MRFPPDIFAGKRFAVVGLGRNGLPAARALADMGADVVVWDDSPTARDAAAGLRVEIPDLRTIDALILSPGIPHVLPAPHPIAAGARDAGVPILSDAELLFCAVRATGSRARFLGITGTNGKSTTTALVAHLLEAAGVPVAAGGNLGPAALSLPLLPHDGVYVLEMSSYMLERIEALRFDVAAMLNLSPDHLDRHGDMDRYVAAKRRIFARQTGADTAVVGVDDAESREMAQWLHTQNVQVVEVSMHDALPDLPPSLMGAHNAQNASAALAIVRAVLADGWVRALPSLATFPGLPHRLESLGRIGDVQFVNDSKATNANSAARALACYDRIVWIAGGMAKAGGIESLAGYFPRVSRAVLIGRDAPEFARTLAASHVPHEIAGTLDAAVAAAFAYARRDGAVVLLSPACASFDQFSGFEARGEKFRELVGALEMAD